MKSALCLLVLILVGCSQHLRPGAFNQFDQNTHDVLRDTQAVLEAAAKDIAPLPVGHPLKVAYNQAIDAYNAAERGYKAYHAALERHEAPDSSPVQALVQGLNTAVQSYVAAKKSPAPMPFLGRAA